MHLDETPAPGQAESALLSRRRRRKSLGALRGKETSSSADPTSPELISSLISSLSTISVPLNSHFDNVPRIDSKDSSDPGLPEVPHTAPCFTIPPSQQNGFGMSFETCLEVDEPQNTPYLHPDDAASSPVIRMARAPPSPKSPKSPRFKSFKSNDASTRPASRDSYASVRAAPEDTAFGTISTEAVLPRVSTATSIASNSSAGRTKSLKGTFGLLRKTSSRDLGHEEDRLRKTNSLNDSLRHNTPRNRASLRSIYSMANVAEEGGPNGLQEGSSEAQSASTPPSKDQPSIQNTPENHNNPGGIGSGRCIPTRDSSMRHRHSQSSGSKQRRSARHSRYSSTASKDSIVENGLPGTSNDAEQVTRRIQELKDQQQRIKTELEPDDSPAMSTKTSPAKQIKPLRSASQLDQAHATYNEPNGDHSSMNDSAPSPSVMTGKSRSGKLGQPLAPKNTNFVSQFPKPPSEKDEQARYRQSLEPVTPTKQHRRTPSGHLSAGRPSINTERPSSADSIDIAVEDYVSSPKLTQRVVHPTSGRTIAFSEVGNPKGHVVLCCLGMGLTRYLMAFYDELARTLNLRLVTLDRPGVGESGPHQLDEPSNPLSWPGKSLIS
jgi:hypothetical protein